jgi:diguanylate cyclase (GGDEF)-like protein
MQHITKWLSIIVIYTLLFVLLFGMIEWYKQSRIDDMLKEQEKYLEISYKQGVDRFNVIGDSIYVSMQNDTKLIDIIAEVNETNLGVKHQEIYEHLQQEFQRLRLSGVMGLQFVRANNQSIFRMHKIEKYGDNLEKTRPMMAQVNRERVHYHGFEEGKSIHAYRQIFPLYKNDNYIGAMEVLFSSTKLQDYTMRASDIHTHFLVSKNVFKTNEWQSNDQEPYEQSIEHKNFLVSFNDHINHDALKLSATTIIKPLQEEINKGIETGKNFQLYQIVNNDAQVLVFYAIKRFVDKKTVAYLVSYTKSQKLYDFLESIKITKVALFLLIVLSYFVAVGLLSQKETVLNELKFDALTNVYNRKYFMSFAHKKYELLRKEDGVFTLVMVDIDFFKDVNDTYGHQYGDVVLQQFAKIFRDSIRSVDVVARYGGEEFILILLTNSSNALRIVQEIRKKIERNPFGEQSIALTASFGIVECWGKSSFEEELKKVDKALYKAKEGGRNRVEVL